MPTESQIQNPANDALEGLDLWALAHRGDVSKAHSGCVSQNSYCAILISSAAQAFLWLV